MKNIRNENPFGRPRGRLKFTLESFVDKADVKGKTVLDVGCGYGWFENFALKNGVKKIYGNEITATDLSTARKHIKNKKVVFEEGSAIAIPYKDSMFDTVVSWEVLEHIPKNTEKDMFSEVYRVLKPGGAFYFSTPFDSIPAKMFDPGWWLIGHRHYSRMKIQELAFEAGFTVEQLSVKGNWWHIAAILNLYFTKWIIRRDAPWNGIILKNDEKTYPKEGFVNVFCKLSEK